MKGAGGSEREGESTEFVEGEPLLQTMCNKISFSLISLGCPKALVDSEALLGKMVKNGFLLCQVPTESDIVIINTCCFVEEAAEESRTAIKEILALKLSGAVKGVVVFGCMPQRYKEDLLVKYPELDAIVGLGERDKLSEICASILSGQLSASVMVSTCFDKMLENRFRLRITPKHYAYLKISEGCGNRCAYCMIPSIRGPMRSRPMKELLIEARELASDGVVELNLIAQDTAAYGRDIHGASKLHELIHGLSGIESIRWIRMLYAHPAHITEELIGTIATNEKVVKYVDVPVQHACDRILCRMKRRMSRNELSNLLSLMRGKIDGLVLRTTLMVGFPGETEEDFEELLDFVKEQKFDRLGAFRYSREEGTEAFDFPDQVAEDLKMKRFELLMKTQQEIAFKHNKQLVGRIVKVIVDQKSEEKGSAWVGRTYGDAPEIDNRVYFSEELLTPGTILDAKIIAANGYDLIAEPTHEGLKRK